MNMKNITHTVNGTTQCVIGKQNQIEKFFHGLLLILWTGCLIYYPSKVEAAQVWCSIKYIDTSTSEMKSIAISLGELTYSEELCEDTSISLSIVNNDSQKLVSASGTSIATGSDPTNFYKTNTWSKPLTETEKDLYWCILPNSINLNNNIIEKGADLIINILPSSPETIKIPTIIEKELGKGSLGAKLILELYSGCWQALALVALIKLYKLIPFKST